MSHTFLRISFQTVVDITINIKNKTNLKLNVDEVSSNQTIKGECAAILYSFDSKSENKMAN